MRMRSQSFPEVNGDAFKRAREVLGLSEAELGGALCLSAKHIKQLEGNHLNIFFSPSHRYQVAKKVAAHLGMVEQDAFIQSATSTLIDSIDGGGGNDKAEPFKPSNESALKLGLRSSDVSVSQAEGSANKDDSSLSNHQFPDVDPRNINWGSGKFKLIRSLIYSLSGLAVVSIFYVVPMNSEHVSEFVSAIFLTKKIIKEEGLTPSEVAEESKPENENLSSPVNAASPLAVLLNKDTCSVKASEPYTYTNPNPSKPANYVYLVAKEKTGFCIVDADGAVTNAALELGASKSVYGKPPFVLVPNYLPDLEVYYEGNKLWNLPADIKALKLVSRT